MGGICHATVLADQPHVLRPDEEGEGAIGLREIRANGRVDRLEQLPAPAELDAVCRGFHHRAPQHVANTEDPRHALRGRPPQELAAGRSLDHLARLVHDDLIAQPVRLLDIVGDEDGRHVPVRENGRQLLAQGLAQPHVERGERLVEEQEGRIGREGTAEGDPLALASRDLVRPPMLEAAQAHALDHFGHPAMHVRARPPAQPEADIGRHGEMRKKRVALEHIAQAASLRRHVDSRRPIEEHAVAHHDAARVGLEQTGQALEGEGLARSRWSEEHRDTVTRRPFNVQSEAGHSLDEADVEAMAHHGRAPRRADAITTAHDRSVSTATRAMACPASPVCTAV